MLSVLRVRKTSRSTDASALQALMDGSERVILRIHLPEGLYVMKGSCFQNKYSHEFPQLHPALFNKLCKLIDTRPISMGESEDMFIDFPRGELKSEKGATRLPTARAEWLKAHRDAVEQLLVSSDSRSLKRQRTLDSAWNISRPSTPRGNHNDLKKFDEWCLERSSYTLRRFDDPTQT